MAYQQGNNGDNMTRSITGVVVMIVFFIGLFIIARFILKLLYLLSPLMFIAAIALDYKTVLGYGQWLINLVKRNTASGVLAIVASLLLFPFVSAYLLGKAWLSKKTKGAREEQRRFREGDLIDYEEMDSRPLEFPEMEPRRRQDEDDMTV